MNTNLTRYTTSGGYLRCLTCYNSTPGWNPLSDLCEYADMSLVGLITAADAHELEHHMAPGDSA